MKISAWIILIFSSAFLVETFSTPIPFEVTLFTKKPGEEKKNTTLVVNECVYLKQRGIDGVLVSIEHLGNCVEVHQLDQCDGDFVIAKPGVPATEKLYRWNVDGSRPWIDLKEGAKAVRPCRDKCDPANLVLPKRGQVVQVSLYSDIEFHGTNENVTIKGCQVIPKSLRNNVASLLTDGSYCIELHETRKCAGAFIEIPRKVLWHFTRNLETNWNESYYSSGKAVALSLCGYNCPHSGLKVETTPAEPEQLPQGQVALTLYTEPHFQGEKVNVPNVDLTEVGCYKFPISSPLKVVTYYESVDTHEECFHLFEKNGECNREKGNFITVSNWEEGSDLVLRGLTGEIKSIAPCHPKKNLFLLLLSLFLVAILVLAFVIVAIYLKRKQDKSPKIIPKQKYNSNAPGSNQCTEPLIPESNRNGREDTGGRESVALLPHDVQYVPGGPMNIPLAAGFVSPVPTVVDPAPNVPTMESPKLIPKPKHNLNARGSNQCTEPLNPPSDPGQLEDNFRESDIICSQVDNKEEQAGPSSSCRNILNSQNEQKSQLSDFVDSKSEINWPIYHGFSKTANNFSGRKTELKKLKSHFNSKEGFDLVLICGFGGIGKTELCRKFANGIPEEEVNSSKITRVWLHGDSIETLRDSILTLAEELGVNNDKNPTPSQYFNVLASKILKNCSRLLVIVDNVDTAFEEVNKVIMSVRSHMGLFIIVTSRNRSVLKFGAITLPLDVLEDRQASIMLKKSFLNLTNAEAKRLCELLQNFPLGLQQAVAYIKQQQQKNCMPPKYSVANYVDEFKRKKSAMLDQKLIECEHNYNLTTLVVWDMTLEKMSEGALEIMKVLAYLEPDKILIHFLQNIVRKLNPTNNFKESLNMIHNYSLVKVEDKDKSLSIHRLVQEVMRLKTLDSEYPKSLFDTALLAWVEGRQNKFDRVPKHDRQQLNTICKFAFDCEVERFDDFEVVLKFLFNVGRIDCAVEYTKLCFEGIKMIKFSSSLDDQGKKELIDKSVLFNIINGHDHSRDVTDEIIENGDYDIHIPDNCDITSLQMIFNLVQKFFPHRMSYEIRTEIIMVLKMMPARDQGQSQGRCILLCQAMLESSYDSLYEDAFNLFLKFEFDQRFFFKPNSLGCAKKELLEKLLESKRIRLGESHSNTLKVTEMLADVLEEHGDLESAFRLWKQLRDFANQYLFKSGGEALEHSYILDLHKNKLKYELKVSDLELRLGNFENLMREERYSRFSHFNNSGSSIDALKSILTICKDKLGENDKLTLRVKIQLAVKLDNEKKWAEALSILEEIISSNKEDEVEVAYYWMYNIAENLYRCNEYPKSRAVLEKVLTYRISHLGENHLSTNKTKILLAMTLRKLGDSERAGKLKMEALHFFKEPKWNNYLQFILTF